MFDLWVRDTEITLLIAAAAVLVLALQLLLCFRAKKLPVKLLPAVLSVAAVIAFYTLMITATDWSALGYLIFAAIAGAMLLFSGIGWGIWAIVKLAKKDNVQA